MKVDITVTYSITKTVDLPEGMIPKGKEFRSWAADEADNITANLRVEELQWNLTMVHDQEYNELAEFS